MTTSDDLPSFDHESAPESRGEDHVDANDGGTWYTCIHCGWQGPSVRVPDPCDERIRAWGRERYHNGVRDAFYGRVALAANEADPTGPLIVVPVERMDDLAAPTPTPHEG